MFPKISIITPCFNAEKHIEQTILSIIEQDYNNLEYIIIDGGSTDSTVDIIKKYEDRIAFWISETDNGQSHAINKGIEIASGDIFNWINADDYLENGALKLIATEFVKEEIDIVCTNTVLFNEHGNIRINGEDSMNLNLFDLLNSTGLNQMGMYWSLDIVKQLNGVNNAFNYSMDLDLFKRYLLTHGADKIRFINSITGYFRLSNNSKTGVDFSENFHFFEEENHAALCQYALIGGLSYIKPIHFLFPKFKVELATLPLPSPISNSILKWWMKKLFYTKAKQFFYANDFKLAFQFIQTLSFEEFEEIEQKDLRSFKRWSRIRRWM